MLRIKKSEVLLSAIHGVGSVALVLFILKLAVPLAFLGPIGLQILAYVGGAIMMGLGVWILIRIQDDNHANKFGYWDVVLYVLDLLFVALAIHWIVTIVLFFALIFVGLRFTPKPAELKKERSSAPPVDKK